MTSEPTRGRARGVTAPIRSLLVAIPLIAAACGSPAATAAGPSASAGPSAAQPSAAESSTARAATAAPTVWLCLPGKPGNPCEAPLTTTVIETSGKRTVETLTPAADPSVDCFYVYPTTSKQQTMNADLSIDPELVTIATWQAAPFSQVCKVYAPIYPQVTIAALQRGPDSESGVTAYVGLLAAFDDYMANYNRGRGVVLMGHSQGAMLLVSLIEDRFDNVPEARRLLVSALLLGGSATTGPDKATGGVFTNIPTCASNTQTGCAVGYSSFWETPPSDAMFGRAANAVAMLRRPQPGERLMCVNPAAPGGGSGTLKPMIASVDLPRVVADPPSPLPTTTFTSYPNAYTAECRTDGNDAWLLVTRTVPAGSAPTLTGTEGPTWGLHDFDVAGPLGNLLDLVRAEAGAFRS